MLHFYLRVKPAETVKTIISISKKVSKSAVIRNTIRRRIRPILQELSPRLKSSAYFIVANPGAEKIKGKELAKELLTLFRL